MRKASHVFNIGRLRKENAIHDGEMSLQYHFRDFHNCDSDTIHWLLVMELICVHKRLFSALVKERIRVFPLSEEIDCHISASWQVSAAVDMRNRGLPCETE